MHAGKLPIQSSQPEGSRGRRPRPGTHALTTRGVAEPNAAQSLPKPTSEKPLAGVGPTSAKRPSRRQEVADEKPFRYTTAGYPVSHRGWAEDTQSHRLRYSGVEQPHRGSSGRPACAFGFPKPVRGGSGASCELNPEGWLSETQHTPTHPQTFGISMFGKAQPEIPHPRKKQATRKRNHRLPRRSCPSAPHTENQGDINLPTHQG